MVAITLADLDDPAFAALVERHMHFCDGTAPAESCHRLPLSELAAPDVTVWTAHADGTLLGMGALKAIAQGGEIKSMHTVAEARGQGVGKAMLSMILREARARGYEALWLETGAHPDFTAARRLYAAHEFAETTPFGDYVADPHSIFMTRLLEACR